MFNKCAYLNWLQVWWNDGGTARLLKLQRLVC